MPIVEWDDRLSVHIGEIDNQHKNLFAMINTLDDALSEDLSEEVVDDILSEMTRYAILHFATEERYHTRTEYPGAGEHRELHEAFVEEVKNLRQQRKTGDSKAVAADALRFLSTWLLDHIAVEDRKFGAFVDSHCLHPASD